MTDARIDFSGLECTGEASCVGGSHPDPPLEGYPLLAWMVSHPRHGSKVMTEDGAASVESIALALAHTPSVEGLAEKFETTPDHISQAIRYAVAAGFLSSRK